MSQKMTDLVIHMRNIEFDLEGDRWPRRTLVKTLTELTLDNVDVGMDQTEGKEPGNRFLQ